MLCTCAPSARENAGANSRVVGQVVKCTSQPQAFTRVGICRELAAMNVSFEPVLEQLSEKPWQTNLPSVASVVRHDVLPTATIERCGTCAGDPRWTCQSR